MKNFIKLMFVLLFMNSSFIMCTSDAKCMWDCYDKDGHLYHPKINLQDFSPTGHLISDDTIEKIKNIHKQNGSPSFYKVSKKNSELFLTEEKPRSVLFMNEQIFISYRDLGKPKAQGYLGARPIKGSRNSEIPFLYENNNKKFTQIKDNVKLAWSVKDKAFVAIRVTFSAYSPNEDPNQALKRKGFWNERGALRKMNRLYGELKS